MAKKKPDEAAESEPQQAEEPQEANLDDLSAEDIAAEINRRADAAEETEPMAEEEPEPAEAEAAAEEPPEAEGQEPAEDEDPLKRITRELEEERLLREKYAQRMEHIQFLHDRRSGEIGHLKKLVQELQTGHRAPQQAEQGGEDYDVEPQPRQSAPPPQELPSEFQEAVTEWRRAQMLRAAEDAVAEVRKRHEPFLQSLSTLPDEEQKEFNALLDDKIKQEATNLGIADAASAGDLKRVTSISRAAYSSAMVDSRIEFMRKPRSFSKAAADQAAALKEKKKAASSGAPAVSPPPRSGPKYNDLMDVPVDEIKQEIDRRSRLGLRRD